MPLQKFSIPADSVRDVHPARIFKDIDQKILGKNLIKKQTMHPHNDNLIYQNPSVVVFNSKFKISLDKNYKVS